MTVRIRPVEIHRSSSGCSFAAPNNVTEVYDTACEDLVPVEFTHLGGWCWLKYPPVGKVFARFETD